MTDLILQSVALLALTFLVFAGLGAALAGPKKRKGMQRMSAFDEPAMLTPELTRPQPVRYLDAAAEHFTAGVVATKTLDLDRPAYVPFAPTQFETVAVPAPAAAPPVQEDFTVDRRVSTLVVMTPESVEAAVQQAGTGLEPLRLRGPQGYSDDLTVISGITADQQKQLNDYGVYHFRQIAGWSPENVAWVSQRVLSPHRIARENWMAQAARLAGLKG